MTEKNIHILNFAKSQTSFHNDTTSIKKAIEMIIERISFFIFFVFIVCRKDIQVRPAGLTITYHLEYILYLCRVPFSHSCFLSSFLCQASASLSPTVSAE